MPETVKPDLRKAPVRLGRLIEQVKRIPEGAELLSLIDDFCGHGKTVFHATNERQTNFNIGKQSVANWLHLASEKYEQNEEQNDEY